LGFSGLLHQYLLLVFGIKSDKAAVEIEVERSLVLHLSIDVFKVLENALIDDYVSSLPRSE